MTESADELGAARVIFVCTANICRSPMSELMFASALRASGGAAGGLEIGSAGVRARTGDPIAQHAADLLRQRGLNTDSFRSRPLTPELASADLILTAAREHRPAVLELLPSAGRRLFTIREFDFLLEGAADQRFQNNDPARRLRELVQVADRQRGLRRPDRPSDFDLEDPIGRRKGAFKRTLGLIEQSLDRPVRMLVS